MRKLVVKKADSIWYVEYVYFLHILIPWIFSQMVFNFSWLQIQWLNEGGSLHFLIVFQRAVSLYGLNDREIKRLVIKDDSKYKVRLFLTRNLVYITSWSFIKLHGTSNTLWSKKVNKIQFRIRLSILRKKFQYANWSIVKCMISCSEVNSMQSYFTARIFLQFCLHSSL